MMFAPISRTFLHSYEIPDEFPAPPEYQRNQITLPVNLGENLFFLAQWKKVFNGESFDYDYPLGKRHYGDMGYVHIAHIIYEDIHRLKDLHLDGYISCQELRCFLPNGLPNYIMGNCLFGTDASFEELAEEYFQAAYGENWKDCLTYLSELSSLCDCDYYNGKNSRLNPQIAANMETLSNKVQSFRGKYFTKKELLAVPVQQLFGNTLTTTANIVYYYQKPSLFLQKA